MERIILGFSVPKEFAEAIETYNDILSHNYSCRTGDEESEASCIKAIRRTYVKAQQGDRIYLLYFALKEIIGEGFRDERYGNWRRELAVKLTNELEQIQ